MEEKEQKILDFMKNEDYVPMKAKEIAMLMRVPKNEYNNFLEIIGKLELELKIQKNRKNRYRISEKTYYEGYYRKNQKGFGFVKIEDQEDEIYISRENSKNALNGDTVAIKIIAEKAEFCNNKTACRRIQYKTIEKLRRIWYNSPNKALILQTITTYF